MGTGRRPEDIVIPPLIMDLLVNPGRVCPSRQLALRTVYLVVACVLSIFDVSPVLDVDGNPRMPKIEFGGAIVRYVFLEPSIHHAADIDGLMTSHQGSRTLRMHYQASF